MDRLVDDGVKALVIACNSASAATLRDARERYSVPVIEVVHPAVRRAVAATRNGIVGVIGTEATITSQAYDDAFAAAPHIALHARSCPRFVELVEAGVTSGDDVIATAREYLTELQAASVDTLVLGCTHYPFLTGAISYVMGDSVTLVSSAEETAQDVYRVFVANDLLREADAGPPEYQFLVTGDPSGIRTPWTSFPWAGSGFCSTSVRSYRPSVRIDFKESVTTPVMRSNPAITG